MFVWVKAFRRPHLAIYCLWLRHLKKVSQVASDWARWSCGGWGRGRKPPGLLTSHLPPWMKWDDLCLPSLFIKVLSLFTTLRRLCMSLVPHLPPKLPDRNISWDQPLFLPYTELLSLPRLIMCVVSLCVLQCPRGQGMWPIHLCI